MSLYPIPNRFLTNGSSAQTSYPQPTALQPSLLSTPSLGTDSTSATTKDDQRIKMTSICSRVLALGVAQGSRFLRTNPSPSSFPIHQNRNQTVLKFPSQASSSSLSSTIFCRMASAVSNGGDGVVRFPMSQTSALVIQKGDITQWFINGTSDAIVCFFSVTIVFVAGLL